jgi:lipopolysaccharide export LptBFGC system permease protein LptF
VSRKTVLWCITVFFGASITFQAIKSATENSSAGISLGLQAVALVLMIVAVVLIVRKQQ